MATVEQKKLGETIPVQCRRFRVADAGKKTFRKC
jgi:hypothetical protein